jgi:hypothetical protein
MRMISWSWLHRDFPIAFSEGMEEEAWLRQVDQVYLQPNLDMLTRLHFLPNGYLGKEQVLKRLRELGRSAFSNLVQAVQADGYEDAIVWMTDEILARLKFMPSMHHEVHVLVGLQCTNIYSVEFEEHKVTVMCLESVQGRLEGVRLLMAHECHHWARQEAFMHDLFGAELGERVVTEGLAACFSEDVQPGLGVEEYCFVPRSTVEWTLLHWEELDRLIMQQVEGRALIDPLFSCTPEPSELPLAGMPPRVGFVYSYLKMTERLQQLRKNAVQMARTPWQEVLDMYRELLRA